jgi:hypothetical protein
LLTVVSFYTLVQNGCEILFRMFIDALLALKRYTESTNNAEEATMYTHYLTSMRGIIEKMQPHCPGSLTASGVSSVAIISKILNDRDLNVELSKMKSALHDAIDLDYLPIDVCVLKRTIGEWTHDIQMVSEAARDFRTHRWMRDAIETDVLVEELNRRDTTGLIQGNNDSLQRSRSNASAFNRLPPVLSPRVSSVVSTSDDVIRSRSTISNSSLSTILISSADEQEFDTLSVPSRSLGRTRTSPSMMKVLISNEIALNKVKLDELDNQMAEVSANVARARTDGDRTAENLNVSLMLELQDEIRGLREFDKTTFAQRINQARELDNELNN